MLRWELNSNWPHQETKSTLCIFILRVMVNFSVDMIYLINPYTDEHELAKLKPTTAQLKLEVTHNTCLKFRPRFWPKLCTVIV